MEANTGASYLSSGFMNDDSSIPKPPPYTDEPPAYSSIAPAYTYNYSNAQRSPVYLGNPSAPITYPPPAREIYSHPQQPIYPPMANQQISHQPIIVHQTHRPIVDIQSSHTPGAPHKALLQPTSSRMVQTTVTGRRKAVSHVTDFETGKEYIIKERTSRRGLRSKAVIQEVGGPRTIVKETPRRTIVRQKNY